MNSANLPIIPETITVHLGTPDSSAENVTLSFADYIANVASSEIYPTWPESALRANIYAQISYALNRVYTEFYRARGYSFDITNSTSVDQSFIKGREIFDNINAIVGDIFNSYIRREGSIEPLFAAYCDGVQTQCGGLSQWGTVALAEQGLSTIDILKSYYGSNIEIVQNVPIEGVTISAPTIPLRIGQSNDDVRTIQIRLNRIATNYPGIPKIAFPDGIFDQNTENSVKEFQRIFGLIQDGIVGNATWYKILQVYNGVKRLNELTSEGIALSEVTKQFPSVLSLGSRGVGVLNLQYYINYLSEFYSTIPSVAQDGIFGPDTEAAVRDMQTTFGLVSDGIVGEQTWNAMYNNYIGIVRTIPIRYTEGVVIPFPGITLRLGSDSDDVRLLQEYLNYIAGYYSEIPGVTPTGYFGQLTQASVTAFEREFGFTPNGIVDAALWNAITDVYSDLYHGSRLAEGQYPGYTVGL